MRREKVIISGTGCALADFLYADVRFDSPDFTRYQSLKPGDGGLSPGKLVFKEELEEFAGADYHNIIREITSNQAPDAFNIGGPGLVPMINASQLLNEPGFEVKFWGGTGSDKTAVLIYDLLKQTPLDTSNFRIISGKPTPFTDVFSDPSYHKGHGERTFVNNIGAAWDYSPDYLTDKFYASDIVCFGGTALVPQIHDNLTILLEKAKRNNCLTVVNTVFDFRNERINPGRNWPLGNTPDSLKLIDLLIMDREEAFRISASYTLEQAIRYFTESRVGSFIITNGPNDINAWSDGRIFEDTGLIKLPVSSKVVSDIINNPACKGDTTGCGDNFVGGAVASMAWQIRKAETFKLNLIDTISWAIASGGFTCYYIGGTYLESRPGEKLARIKKLRDSYLEQTGYK